MARALDTFLGRHAASEAVRRRLQSSDHPSQGYSIENPGGSVASDAQVTQDGTVAQADFDSQHSGINMTLMLTYRPDTHGHQQLECAVPSQEQLDEGLLEWLENASAGHAGGKQAMLDFNGFLIRFDGGPPDPSQYHHGGHHGLEDETAVAMGEQGTLPNQASFEDGDDSGRFSPAVLGPGGRGTSVDVGV